MKLFINMLPHAIIWWPLEAYMNFYRSPCFYCHRIKSSLTLYVYILTFTQNKLFLCQ
jgi:hypothetical protein